MEAISLHKFATCEPTAKFLDHIMTRLTLFGAISLTIIAVFPDFLLFTYNVPFSVAIFFGGTGMLITVGVLLDLMRQIETYLLQRHYDGFLKRERFVVAQLPETSNLLIQQVSKTSGLCGAHFFL